MRAVATLPPEFARFGEIGGPWASRSTRTRAETRRRRWRRSPAPFPTSIAPPYGRWEFTPYGPDAVPEEVQQLFTAITSFILPPGLDYQILDWSGPRLPEVSALFAAGMEWWGVFLFTVSVPALRRLTIVAGSTSD
jgi:hypothetical protein